MGPRILITSGKGGTGKTALTAALSGTLAALGHRVVCVDLDIGLRNLDVALGLTDKTALDFADVLRGAVSLEEALVSHPDLPSLFLLSAPLEASPSDIPPAEFAALTATLTQTFDYCFLDCPSGLEAGFRIGAAACDRAIVVSALEVAALRDAARVAESLEPWHIPVHLVLNRVRTALVRDYNTMNVDDAMDTTGLPLLGLVPEDVEVIIAGNYGVPLVLCERKGAARAVLNIARRLEGKHIPIREKKLKMRF